MTWFTNSQMMSPEELHEAHLEMAIKYLESKWDGDYYELDPVMDGTDDDDVDKYDAESDWGESIQIDDSYPHRFSQGGSQYVKLSSKQLLQIQKRLNESGERLLYKALADDPELRKLILIEYEVGKDENYEQYFGLASKISDIPHQICDVTVCTLDSNGKTNVFPYHIMLTREEYLKLLVIVMDHRDVTFNNLYEYDLDLFKKISEINNAESISSFEEGNKLSYTLFFKDIEEAVFELLGEAETVVKLCDFDDEFDGDTIASISVRFDENRMVVLHNYVYPFENVTEALYDIDATAVLKALNVNSYHDAGIVLKDRFYGISAYKQIEAFLKSNGIAYEFHRDSFEYDEDGNPMG